MSHEIRTPLSAVIGFVELLEQESLSEEATAWLKSTNSAAHILLDLISTILDFSKIEAGKMELDPRPIDVYELVTQVSDMLRPTAQRKGLQLIVDMLDTNDRIFVLDDVRLKQILINLSGNALKFCEKGAVTLLLRVREVENTPDCAELCFQVRDTGPGISPDQQKKLFKAFSQADASIARRYGGTGLGLALSTLLVHKMGGELELDSEVGKGSVFGFCITVPRGDASEVAASSSNQCNETNAFTQAFRDMTVCVLIAEDVEMNRFLLERSVHRLLPYATILLASNGQEAEALYKKHTPDIILLDIQMPEYDGIWAVERIRTQEAEQGKERVPIIGVSAGAQIEEKSAALAAGMDDYVVKPVETARLQEVFMRFIKQVDRAELKIITSNRLGRKIPLIQRLYWHGCKGITKPTHSC
jgi:CheY-like chemotaxis protein